MSPSTDGSLGWTKDVDLPFEKAREHVEHELGEEGFGILSEIPVAETLEAKLGVSDFPQYAILGACNPELANEALRQNRDVGLLMPCNVTLEAVADRTTRVSFVRPEQLLDPWFGDDATMCALAEGAEETLREVFDRL